MIFFFHHYELLALLEQIRHQQQQQQQMPPHHDQQANGHPAPDNNAHPDDDSDQSGSDRSVNTEAEEQRVGVSDASIADQMTADADNTSNRPSSVDCTERGQFADVDEHTVHQLHRSHNDGSIAENTSRQSAALTSLTSMSATLSSDADGQYHFSAVDTEDSHAQSGVLLLPSHNVPISAADVRRLASPDVGSSAELRQRCCASNSSSPCSSQQAFANCQDYQELCTNRPSSGMMTTDSSLTDVSRNTSNVPSTNPSGAE